VLLFKRILDFKDPPLMPSDKRSLHRYPAGQPFPFEVHLALNGRDAQGRSVPDEDKKQDWPAVLINASHTGACLEFEVDPGALRDEACTLKITRDDYTLVIPVRIAHSELHNDRLHYGITFRFAEFETEKAYLQLLEPVTIGASLAPVPPVSVTQDMPGLLKEQYHGTQHAELTVWRHARNKAIYSFDFRMNEYGVRWSEGQEEVEPYGLERSSSVGGKAPALLLALTDDQLDEVRWLFCLAVPNLAQAVRADVRHFLTALVAV
jgi:hypothetical protein